VLLAVPQGEAEGVPEGERLPEAETQGDAVRLCVGVCEAHREALGVWVLLREAIKELETVPVMLMVALCEALGRLREAAAVVLADTLRLSSEYMALLLAELQGE
jgi:hypothetical protein